MQEATTYIKGLNANTISLNFAFSMTSLTSNDPHAGTETPSPQLLAALIHIIRANGLNVQIRPELDETGFPNNTWRGLISPTNLPLWFSNYEAFLAPYLEASKLAGANGFVIGVELSSLLTDEDGWSQVVQQAHTLFGPNIQYSQSHNTIRALPGADFGWDFYTQMTSAELSGGVNLSTLAAAMAKNLLNPSKDNSTTSYPLPVPLTSTMLEEVGVPAEAYGYLNPTWVSSDIPPGTPIDRQFQANWFTAACNVVFADHLQGLSFWAIYLPDWSPEENDSADYSLWSGTTSEDAIKTCFARTQ